MPWIDKQSDHSGPPLVWAGGCAGGASLAVTSPRVNPGGNSVGARSVAIECIMMRHLIGRRAWTGIDRYPLGALAADIFVARFAHLALGKASDRWRDAIGDPMIDAGTAAAFGVDHKQNEALGAFRDIAPRELRRNIIADTVRIGRHVCFAVGNLFRQHFAVRESGRFQRENVRR